MYVCLSVCIYVCLSVRNRLELRTIQAAALSSSRQFQLVEHRLRVRKALKYNGLVLRVHLRSCCHELLDGKGALFDWARFERLRLAHRLWIRMAHRLWLRIAHRRWLRIALRLWLRLALRLALRLWLRHASNVIFPLSLHRPSPPLPTHRCYSDWNSPRDRSRFYVIRCVSKVVSLAQAMIHRRCHCHCHSRALFRDRHELGPRPVVRPKPAEQGLGKQALEAQSFHLGPGDGLQVAGDLNRESGTHDNR